MNRTTFSVVIIILLFNAARYSSYLLGGSSSIYYLSMFLLNIAGLITIVLSRRFTFEGHE
ncbi:hypothetical protein [Bacillus sp. P14.5]|uniref:hypothetical protein n=1 Tax=Bacillus sp. P14.5 TaxID=1983400 RepID=UPI000DE881F4|nr:hypothetical protein [Bacillus sp. P14.5]